MTISVLLITFWIVVFNCSEVDAQSKDTSKHLNQDRTLMATTGMFSITLPEEWQPLKGLNTSAELQAGNLEKEEYLIIMTDLKEEDFAGTLAEHAKIIGESVVQKSKDGKITRTTPIKLNGLRAIQNEIQATINGTEIRYLQTDFEGKKGFYQILCWTTASRQHEAFSTFGQVIATFKETN